MTEPSIYLLCVIYRGNGMQPETFTKIPDVSRVDGRLSGLGKYCVQYDNDELKIRIDLSWSEQNQRYESDDGKFTFAP